MKAYGATNLNVVRADDESTDDSIDFDLDGHECSLQVCAYSNVVVAWNTYERNDAGDIVSGRNFENMADFVNYINPVRARK